MDTADHLDPDFRKHKARIAAYVPPTMFPATGARIVAEARRNNAPDEVLRLLEQLKQGHRFANTEQFWSALGLA